jgi:hypothetical protein
MDGVAWPASVDLDTAALAHALGAPVLHPADRVTEKWWAGRQSRAT